MKIELAKAGIRQLNMKILLNQQNCYVSLKAYARTHKGAYAGTNSRPVFNIQVPEINHRKSILFSDNLLLTPTLVHGLAFVSFSIELFVLPFQLFRRKSTQTPLKS